MYLIYLATTLVLIWFSIAGITLTNHRYLSDFAIARTTGLLLVALVLFFIEHFVGLGKLNWMLPIIVLFSVFMIWRNYNKSLTREFLYSELVFFLAFIYGLFWRYSYPGISPSSEKITDLFFISNYYPGNALPPLDNWNPPHLFDYYYAFQHYAAALLGRIFNLDIGVCYNLSFALLAALTLTLAWSVSGYFIQKKILRLLLISTLALGGTGISPILHLFLDSPNLPDSENNSEWAHYEHAVENYSRRNIIASARFIGGEFDKKINESSKDNTSISSSSDSKIKHDKNKPLMVLPAENFGYQYFLGDYHPTQGGFLLLVFVFALMVHSEKSQQIRLSQALLAFCMPVMLITNTWTFPLLTILILIWIGFRVIYKLPIDWQAMIVGGAAGAFLIYPFLYGFTANSLSTPVEFVTGDMHTPITRFLGMHWPLLVLISIGIFEKKHRHLSVMLSVTWMLMLCISEFIYINDPTGAQYERTNTVMKWWGWIQTGAVVSLGAVSLGSSIKWIRWSAIVVFLVINIVAIDLARYWFYSGRNYQGKLAGHDWYTKNATNRMMFEYLKEAPKGVVLESIQNNAYSNTSIYGIFNDKPVLLGWPSHLNTWHGKIPRIWILKSEIDKFYLGEMENTLNWLAANNVEYIVFGPHDNNGMFERINEKIKMSYAWYEFNHSRQRHTGIWVKTKMNTVVSK
jgi:hypothetical protein